MPFLEHRRNLYGEKYDNRKRNAENAGIYAGKSINIISCYIHYQEILHQELFPRMIILYLESGIRQKLKVWKAVLKSRKSIWKICWKISCCAKNG